MVDLIS